MRRLHVRGLDEVRKKLLIQAAACNLALLLRTKHGAGTPRGQAETLRRLCAALLRLLSALRGPTPPVNPRIDSFGPPRHTRSHRAAATTACRPLSKTAI